MAAAVQYYGTGRRKTSTARVFLRPGSGTLTINRRKFEEFFPTEALRTQIKTPMVLTETADKFDVLATVAGFIEAFTGSNRFVIDYLADEVLVLPALHGPGRLDGRGVVRGVEIGNPPGFTAPRAARLGRARSSAHRGRARPSVARGDRRDAGGRCRRGRRSGSPC